ncbi:MAG: hypothetical protein WCJ35_23460 [Planctomycetota bacterium]
MKLDPVALFQRLANDISDELHKNLFVTGSLAAAYHFRAQLEERAINTKDADVVVHPAGNIASCQQMAARLIELGWTRTEECYPRPIPEPKENLRAIRLYPPGPHDYFIEFLNLPSENQEELKEWIPVELDDGWYGLPSFRFLSVTSLHRLKSGVGLEYASPSMMALANLLAHRQIGTARIESGPMVGLLRAAKDLGRVIALARLAGRNETERWLPEWLEALQLCFPGNWGEPAFCLGDGLKELLGDDNALDDAQKTTDVGLLNGQGVTSMMLRATAERLLLDVIDPLAQRRSWP